MRFWKIFLLNFQNVFEYRGRSFVWFIIGLVGPLTMLFFWYAASESNTTLQFSTIASYYLLLIPISITLTSHIDQEIAYEDIRDGVLTQYLTRPLAYYWFNFFEEVPYRLLQGCYGVIIIGLIAFFFPHIISMESDPWSFLLAACIFIFGYILCFTYKMIIGFTAFWLTDIGGFIQFENMIFFVFAGYMMPLQLLPEQLEHIAQFLPFAYMMYYPVLAVQGILSLQQLLFIFFIQLCWLIGLLGIYHLLWQNGLKKFTAVGQ